MKKEDLSTLLGGLVGVILAIPLLLWFFDVDLQIENSLFKGFRYVEDEHCNEMEKVVYHGKLEKLAMKDEHLLFNFLEDAEWEKDHYMDTEKYDTICRVECKDYIITYCDEVVNSNPYYGFSYVVRLPEDITYYDDACADNVEFLVIDRKTDETVGFTKAGLEDWLWSNFRYEK